MKLTDLIETLSLDVQSGKGRTDRAVSGAYVSDLLSDVMANGQEGNIWITLQTHMNIVAVAGLKKMVGIIIVNGRRPPPDVVQKAEAEGIPIMTTPLQAFEAAGRLYQILK